MVSITSRTPVKRINSELCCPNCGTGGTNVGSREGLKAIRHGGDDNRLAFECDSCPWSSRVYEYTGDNPTPLSHLYEHGQSVTFHSDSIRVDGTPLQNEAGYKIH